MSVRLQTHQTELIVLAVLQTGPMYGYGIGKRVLAKSGGELKLGPGVLYPLLASLEQSKLVSASWDEGSGEEGGRKRKWYRLTAKGKKRLESRVRDHRAQLALIESFISSQEEPSKAEGGTE